MLICEDCSVLSDPEFTSAEVFVPCDGMRSGRRTKLQPPPSPRVPESDPDRRRPEPDKVFWHGTSPFRFTLSRRIESARLLMALPDTFLRIGTGEWVSLRRAFAGKKHYLGAVRSFLHPHGDLERMRARAA